MSKTNDGNREYLELTPVAVYDEDLYEEVSNLNDEDPEVVSAIGGGLGRQEAKFENSKQEDTPSIYDKIVKLLNDLSGGKIDKATASKELSSIGEEVTDNGLNSFLNVANLICQKCEGDDLKNASSSVIDNFSYLKGENKDPLANLMTAANAITNDEKIPADLRQEMSDSLAADAFVSDEKSKSKTSDDKEKAAAKKATKSKGKNTSDLDTGSAAKAIKGAVAIGLTVGFPPGGWLIALAFLYFTRNMGNGKDKEKSNANKLGQNLKNAVAGVAKEVHNENQESAEDLEETIKRELEEQQNIQESESQGDLSQEDVNENKGVKARNPYEIGDGDINEDEEELPGDLSQEDEGVEVENPVENGDINKAKEAAKASIENAKKKEEEEKKNEKDNAVSDKKQQTQTSL